MTPAVGFKGRTAGAAGIVGRVAVGVTVGSGVAVSVAVGAGRVAVGIGVAVFVAVFIKFFSSLLPIYMQSLCQYRQTFAKSFAFKESLRLTADNPLIP